MAPKNVKCKRFIAGLYKYKKNKQCPCYTRRGMSGHVYPPAFQTWGCIQRIFGEKGTGENLQL